MASSAWASTPTGIIPYLTYIPNFEAGNVEIFRDMYLKGQVYRGRKPIHWCNKCHTALAEAEIEYSDEVSPSVYVKFKLDAMPGIFEAAGGHRRCVRAHLDHHAVDPSGQRRCVPDARRRLRHGQSSTAAT